MLGLVCALVLLTALPVAGAAVLAEESVWVRDGLADRPVRAVAVPPRSGLPFALIGGAHEPLPLWRRTDAGWTSLDGATPTLILAMVAAPDDSLLLATGRDISDRPGVFHLLGDEDQARSMYGEQAIGALAIGTTERGLEVYAASAPWSDRDGGSELLRLDPQTRSWSVIHRASLNCPSPPFFSQVVTTPSQPGTLYALEWCRTGRVLTSQLWRTDDRGTTWRTLPLPSAEYPLIGSLAVDSADAELLYLAGLGQPGRLLAGVERSLDGGQTWALQGVSVADLSGVRRLLVDPRRPGRVLAGTHSGAVLVSDDRGQTWRSLPGLAGLRIWDLALDTTTGRLYAATSDGVWRTALP